MPYPYTHEVCLLLFVRKILFIFCPPLIVLFRIAAGSTQLAIWTLTLNKFSFVDRPSWVRTPLPSIIMRDGTVVFGVISGKHSNLHVLHPHWLKVVEKPCCLWLQSIVLAQRPICLLYYSQCPTPRQGSSSHIKRSSQLGLPLVVCGGEGFFSPGQVVPDTDQLDFTGLQTCPQHAKYSYA